MITKKCTVSGKEFTITEDDLKFYETQGVITTDDLSGLPDLCPEERLRRRMAYRNFKSLYSRKCDKTGKNIISMYHKEHVFPVYENEEWWGDGWHGVDYGKEFDFNRSFFDQYKALSQVVPHCSTFNMKSENCRYSNFAWESVNCYLIFGCVRNEECMYGHIVWDSKNCNDNLYCFWCEWCSQCTDCSNCYDLHYSTECANCSESYFLHDCRGCTNCFGCTNLRNKEYYWFNEKLGKEEYLKKIAEFKPFSREVIDQGKNWLEKEKKEKCVFPHLCGVNNQDCTGNHFHNSKKCTESFDVKNSEDSKFLYTAFGQQNTYDISFTGMGLRWCVECLATHGSENIRFSHDLTGCEDVWHSAFCYNSGHLFGCHGIRNKKYCILNKQYTKEEYEDLVPKIIDHMKKLGEWGEFFPIGNSPFGYNEAIVQEYVPLTKDEIISSGLLWRESEEEAVYTGPVVSVPDTIEEVSGVEDMIFSCAVTGKNYRVLKNEIQFYKKVELPLPNVCPDERHRQRMALRNPRELYDRKCAECQSAIKTTFAPDRTEKVLCEECYLNTMN